MIGPRMLFGSALVALLLALAPAAPAADPASIQDLHWLAGCWEMIGGEPGSGEQWSAPAGGTLFGFSRVVKGSRTVAHEFLQIRETEAGIVEYVANPSGQTEATFRMVRLTEQEVVFENPDHDFPQRILYRLLEDGTLVGRIEGEKNGQARAVDFPMRRLACGSASRTP